MSKYSSLSIKSLLSLITVFTLIKLINFNNDPKLDFLGVPNQVFQHSRRFNQPPIPATPHINRFRNILDNHGHNSPKSVGSSSSATPTTTTSTSTSSVRTISEVSIPTPNFNAPVYSQKLFNYYFGNSYGFNLVVPYTAPKIDFNRVTVTLSTTSFGVQYDRLAHFFLNDIPLWRPSTAEPGGRNITFSFTKDLSDYLTLWKKDGEIKFQLSNIIDTSIGINGGFNVTATVSYYHYYGNSNELQDTVSSDLFFNDDSVFNIGNEPPTKVIGLISPATTSDIAQILYPDSSFIYSSNSSVSDSTIRAKIRLFVSGNGNEEFWYTNLLDPYVAYFGSGWIGKGPVRIVKVYINNQLVSISSPPPVIYTGGISPTLWSPVVGLNAFDVEALDVDLTMFLPLLSKNFTIDVKVFASAQENGGSDGIPEEDWIMEGSLLLWENDDIKIKSELITLSAESPNEYISVETPDNSTLYQLVQYNSTLRYSTRFEIFDDRSHDKYFFESENSINFYNYQTYFASGYNSTAESHINQYRSLTSNSHLIGEFTETYLTVVNTNETISGSDEILAIEVDQGIDKIFSNLYSLKEYQNGTALFTLASSGNHGTGNTTTNINLVENNGLKYSNNVDS